MRRRIGWKDKTEDGLRREVRVRVHAGQVKWQFLVEGSGKWDYDTPATEADWLRLEGHLADRWQRGQCLEEEIDLVKRRGKPRKG
ncbi:MAG TPA: hypothetical protein PLE92_05240 [Lentisphaeria bacterium]|nr:hypothetical protein [Lentisphaerota bacterium]OQC14782.1 MAG: hypothetical protein BWX73_01650 [Lentisphaerae bacterium ADurb.Bin082]HQC52517.1 hypothetical protein [Lentisphaeria bacterium]HQL86460.1 hypothetical protein [Lentisphaeria bacterium]